MKKEMKQRIAWILVWILLVLCMVPESGVAQAAESGASEVVEEDKVQLDANNKDSQGILYTLDATTHTAMVGAVLDEVDENTSEYAGANDGAVVLPEIVVKDDVEYTVTSVAYGAFWGNTEIQSVVLSDTITTLGQKSFYGSSVKNLSIGVGLESMDAYALGRMTSLTTITVDEGNYSYSVKDGILYNWSGTELVKYPTSRTDTSFVVPDGVYTIGDSAFSLAQISEITMPDTVRLIGNEAFYQAKLTKADLNNVMEIGDYAFSECSQLRWARLRDWVVLGEGVFAENEAMQVVYIPKFAKSKEANKRSAFYGIDKAKCLVIEEGFYFNGIASERLNFERCTTVETVIVEEGVTAVPGYFLNKSEGIDKVYLPSTLVTLSYGYGSTWKETGAQLYATEDTSVSRYLDMYSIEYESLTDHTHTLMEKIHYSDDEIEITGTYCDECGYGIDHSFVVKGDTAKEELITHTLDEENRDEQEIVYTLESVRKTAIVGDTSSNGNNTSDYMGQNDGKVIIPAQVEKDGVIYKVIKIHENAFCYNELIESIEISGDVDIEKPESMLMKTPLLETITISENNPYYKSMDGIMYSRDQMHLIKYPVNKKKKSYEIAAGTKYVDAYAFWLASNLYEITLPKSVKSLGKGCFESTNIKFLDARYVEVLGELCLAYNVNLVNVALGENTKCSRSAIAKCDNLEAIYVSKNSVIKDSCFNDCRKLCVAVLEEGTSLSGNNIFMNCALSKIILPEDLPSIPIQSFYDNLGLKKIYVPESVTDISTDFMGTVSTTLYGKAGTAAASYENFVDITDHEHDLQDTVLYESDYIRITAKFCEECHYATDWSKWY